MRSVLGRLNGKQDLLEHFGNSEEASVTTEYVLWAPVILVAFMLIADVAFALTLNATMWHTSRDTARALSTHRITRSEALDYMKARLMSPERDYEFDVEVDTETVIVSVSIPFSESGATNTLSRYVDGFMIARVMMYREPV